jgi:hypothetical protein
MIITPNDEDIICSIVSRVSATTDNTAFTKLAKMKVI